MNTLPSLQDRLEQSLKKDFGQYKNDDFEFKYIQNINNAIFITFAKYSPNVEPLEEYLKTLAQKLGLEYNGMDKDEKDVVNASMSKKFLNKTHKDLFESFLEALRTPHNQPLIEAIHQGYNVLFEELLPNKYEELVELFNNSNNSASRGHYKSRAKTFTTQFNDEDFTRIQSKARKFTDNYEELVDLHNNSNSPIDRYYFRVKSKRMPQFNENDFDFRKTVRRKPTYTYEELVDLYNKSDDRIKRQNLKLSAIKFTTKFNDEDFIRKKKIHTKLPESYEETVNLHNKSDDGIYRSTLKDKAKTFPQFNDEDFRRMKSKAVKITDNYEELVDLYNNSTHGIRRGIYKKKASTLPEYKKEDFIRI